MLIQNVRNLGYTIISVYIEFEVSIGDLGSEILSICIRS